MRALPLLNDVRVASPCTANWNEMVGDDRVRFCKSCEKNVFNLSAMLAHEAEQLLAERMQGELCVRFYQRADGTVMTQDCPVGVKKKQRRKLAIAVAGAGALAASAAMAFVHREPPEKSCGLVATEDQVVAGGSGPALMGDIEEAPAVMGSAPAPLPPPPVAENPPAVPRHVRMGVRAPMPAKK